MREKASFRTRLLIASITALSVAIILVLVNLYQLNDQLDSERLARTTHEATLSALTDELAALKKQVDACEKRNAGNVIAHPARPLPQVSGRVLNTRKGARDVADLVEIAIGSQDGITAGHELFVTQNSPDGQVLGKIKIIHVTPNRSVGSVIEQARNSVIQKGDNATTKL